MKKSFLVRCNLFAVLLLCHQLSFAQPGWSWQNPQPEGNILNDVAIFGTSYAVAVGHLGLIIRSTDDGETWTKISSGTSNRLYGVSIYQNGTGWAVGSAGTVLKTTDNGLTWVKQPTGNSYTYYSVATNDGVKCFVGAYNGRMYISGNGGTDWTLTTTNTAKNIRSIFCRGNEAIYIAQEGGAIQKSDGNGETWVSQTTHITTALYDIKFSGELGFAVGAGGKILKTTDGGTSWVLVTDLNTYDMFAVNIIDENNIIITGSMGKLLTSTNGGDSFTSSYPITNSISFNACAAKSNLFLAVGDYGQIGKSIDGAVWELKTVGFLDHLYDVFFLDANIGFVCDWEGSIRKTTDGGTTWVDKTPLLYNEFRTLFFVNNNVGYAGGQVILAKTTNGGEDWNTILDYSTTPALAGEILSVFFLDLNDGWIVTDGGKIYKTGNGGTTWTEQSSGVTQPLSDIEFKNPLNGLAVGWNGTFLTTMTGGSAWNKLSNTITDAFTSMYAFDLSNIIVSAFNGKAYKTSDGGVNWNPVTIPSSVGYDHLRRVRFINSTTGWICGEEGTILKSTDGGTTWISQVSNVGHNLHSIFFVDENTGWAVGNGGTIIKTTDGGAAVVSVEKEENFASGFQLYQNYPNPFNPTTTIEYQVPTSPFFEKGERGGFVSLKVYDLLGREVATLVNEQKPAGTYTQQWNAANLPSGVYFYQLKAGTFTETKKIVLMK